jgi:hypothetical protein
MFQGNQFSNMPPPNSVWYRDTIARIDTLKAGMDKKNIKRFKLDYLPKLAARIDGFSAYCPDCQTRRGEITELLKVPSDPAQVTKAELKAYSTKIDDITKHLKKTHKLVTEGQYVSLAMAIGPGVGMAIGAVTENTATGFGIGIALGTGIGALLDYKAKKEGRVI